MEVKLLTFDPRKRKKVLVGKIIGDTLFRKMVKRKHFMKVVDGYGIQEQAMVELLRRGVQKVIIIETDTKRRWKSRIQDWIKHGKVADYSGHGKQRFLSLRYMRSFAKDHQYQLKQK